MKTFFSRIIAFSILLFTGIMPVEASIGGLDYGDAPPPYVQAFHSTSNLWLGQDISYESGQLTIDTYDDGIEFISDLTRGETAQIKITILEDMVGGVLNFWLDFNSNDLWNDSGERISTNLALTQTETLITFLVPFDALPGLTWARFRFNSAGFEFDSDDINIGIGGFAFDGEVEDYEIEILNPVPVPNAMILLGVGMIGLAGIGRRKTK